MKTFRNKKRNRYYGLRVGDTVVECPGRFQVTGKVHHLGRTDNNRVYLRRDGVEGFYPAVAEWCIIIKPVDDYKLIKLVALMFTMGALTIPMILSGSSWLVPVHIIIMMVMLFLKRMHIDEK